MRRTKEFYRRLEEWERSEIDALEKNKFRWSAGFNIPDDCVECGHCSTPHVGTGLCQICARRLDYLIAKGEGRLNDDETL